jgi:hypothetical protein
VIAFRTSHTFRFGAFGIVREFAIDSPSRYAGALIIRRGVANAPNAEDDLGDGQRFNA